MKKIYLTLFLVISLLLPAQVEKIKIQKETDSIPEEKLPKETPDDPELPSYATLNLTYWSRAYTHSFYDRLNSTKNFLASLGPQYAGFGFSGYDMPVNRSSTWTSMMFFNEVVPQTISINDTPTKLNGFAFTLGFGKSLYTRKRNLGISLYFIGFNTGRLTLQNDSMGKQKNQFFSPSISIEPKVIYKRISLSVLISYEHDISKAGWMKVGRNTSELFEGFDQSCISSFISLGYQLRSER
jgi:hypothetical protein